MKAIPPGLLAELQSTSPRIATLVSVQSTAGDVVRYTDHDKILKVGADDYIPALTIARQTTKSTTAPVTQSQKLLLEDFFLTKQDASDGALDGAKTTVAITSWADPSVGTYLVAEGSVGESQVGDVHVDAEIRSKVDQLRQTIIGTYGTACDVNVLGDARCKVNLAPFTFSATVTALVGTDNDQFDAAALSAQPDNWFQFGQFVWTSGANVTVVPFNQVKAHTQETGAGRITLVFPAPRTIQIGDGFDVVAGCDKAKATCINKFDNILNFRGFPDVPGQNAILRSGGQ